MIDYETGKLYPFTFADAYPVVRQLWPIAKGVPDLKRGRRYLGRSNGSDSWEFWLLSGERVSFSIRLRGNENDHFMASVSSGPDRGRPDPIFESAEADALEASFIRPCINPLCKSMVDVRQRKSGACSKACMNFECTHPGCVRRAEANGWSRATHPWGTKVAELHKEYRKEQASEK